MCCQRVDFDTHIGRFGDFGTQFQWLYQTILPSLQCLFSMIASTCTLQLKVSLMYSSSGTLIWLIWLQQNSSAQVLQVSVIAPTLTHRCQLLLLPTPLFMIAISHQIQPRRMARQPILAHDCVDEALARKPHDGFVVFAETWQQASCLRSREMTCMSSDSQSCT